MSGGVLAVQGHGLVAQCVQLYLLHRPGPAATCTHCRTPVLDCAARRNSIRVLLGVGIDPATLDRRAAATAAGSRERWPR